MSEHVYKMVELTGSSTDSIEDAVRRAVELAARTLRHIEWFQIVDTRGHIADGRIAHWQVTVKIHFRIEETVID